MPWVAISCPQICPGGLTRRCFDATLASQRRPRWQSRQADQTLVRNEVTLCGRVAARAESRQLPSGDTVVSARLIIDRDPAALTRSRQRVDTIDCVGWTPRVQRSMLAWQPGQVVSVEGAIRRRFFRGTSGTGKPGRGRTHSGPANVSRNGALVNRTDLSGPSVELGLTPCGSRITYQLALSSRSSPSPFSLRDRALRVITAALVVNRLQPAVPSEAKSERIRDVAVAVYAQFAGTEYQRNAGLVMRAWTFNHAMDECMQSLGFPQWDWSTSRQ